MIQLHDVHKAYRDRRRGEVRALDGLSLAIDAGEFVVVKGPSGSGKSTLLMTIAGMARPTAGRVEVDGRDLYALSGSERAEFRARYIGFVFQMFHLAPYLNVLENVLLPTLAVARPDAREKALALLERFGMADRLTHKPGELSTGERQRTALARALLTDPKLILADEPTGNLDPENAAEVMGYLAEFHQQGGTVVLVTHEAATEEYAQRVVRLQAGRIVDDSDSSAPG